MNDEELNCIHRGMASGGEMMVANKRHMQLAEVLSLSTTNYKKLGIPPILFSKEDRPGLHFPHDNALVIRVHIAKFSGKGSFG